MLNNDAPAAPEAATPERATDSGAPGKSTLTGGILQRHGGGNGGGGGSNQEIAASGFSGPPMSLPYRGEMESSFGRSFSSVQAYGGGAAAQASQKLGAEAYAVGQNVAFSSTSPSKEMVAHELAHTVQQGDAGPVQHWSEGSEGDSFEAEANNAAASVLAGQPAAVSLRTGPAIHRWGGSDHYAIGNLAGQKVVQSAQGAGITDLATANIDPALGGVQHGATASSPGGAGASQSGNADPARRAREQQAGMGGASTGITTGQNNQTLAVGTDGGQVSFGAASRYSGDYSTTVNNPGSSHFPGLAQRNTETSGAGHGGSASTIQFAQMTIGGMTNSNHFFPLNQFEYRGHHANALRMAAEAAQRKAAGDAAGFTQGMTFALQEEGFANHFLQDTFSSGHMAPRSLDSCEDLHNDRHTTATALNNAANGATATVSSGAGSVGQAVGTATGAASGFLSRVAHLQNPFSAEGRAEVRAAMASQAESTGQSFSGAAQSVMQTVTSPVRTGGAINHAVEGAERASAFYNNALQGLERSKQWHDYFCALPNGLPTTRGNFHGDYFMDGNDLETVSDTCANSIAEVVQVAHGVNFHATNVAIPSPNFSAIMADPMAGPVWRLMMQDYRASLAQAKASLQPGDTGHTDGGTSYDSATVLRMIQESTFGGTDGNVPTAAQEQAQMVTQAGSDPAGALHTSFSQMRGIVQDIEHYCTTEFGYNANLGTGATGPGGGRGLDDNLMAPDSSSDLGAGATGRNFDVCQVEGQFGLFTSLVEKATAYKAVLATALSNPRYVGSQHAMLEDQSTLCDAMIGSANAWKTRVQNFIDSSMTIPKAHNGGTGVDPATGRHHTPDADVGTAGRVGANALGIGALGLAGALVGGPEGGAVGLGFGAFVATKLNGAEGNRIAWGAGHPEWISNSAGRNAFRNGEVVPTVMTWFNQTATEPSFALPAAAATHGASHAAGGHH